MIENENKQAESVDRKVIFDNSGYPYIFLLSRKLRLSSNVLKPHNFNLNNK